MSSNDWQNYRLEDFLSKVVDNRGKNPPFSESGYPYIDTTCIVGESRRPDYSLVRKYISKDTYANWFRSGHPRRDDLLIATVGANIGKICLMDDTEACIAQNTVGLRINKEIANPVYVYYLLTSDEIQSLLKSLDVGSAQPSIKVPHLLNVTLDLPPLPTQRRSADILSALDEKIELNRQTNVTLEAMAQSIFREWFVEFNFPNPNETDPKGLLAQHAPRQAKESGITERTQAEKTFRVSDMVESELGMIPQGWRTGSILEVANLLSGGTPSTQVAEYWNGQIKWVSAKDVSNSQGTFVLDTERKVSQSGVNNSSTKVLPVLTTIVTARGTVGSYCILAEPMTMNQTNYGLKAKKENTDYFLFFSLGNLVAHLRQVAYGTIFDTVTTKTFEQSRIIIPPTSLIEHFDLQVKAIMQTILNNLEETATLAALRDTLLPKLMGGEIETRP